MKQLKLQFAGLASVGMPWEKHGPKLRTIVDGEIMQACFECGELKCGPKDPLVCWDCQERGEICR